MGSPHEGRTPRRRPLPGWLVVTVAVAGGAAIAAAPEVAASASSPPPASLDADTRTAIGSAEDDTDRLGEPVMAVLDAVRRREPSTDASAAPPATLDVAAMLADPERWRGRLVRVIGRLEQVAERPAAGPDIREWFIRTDGGPVAVLLVAPPMLAEGRRVTVDGWVIRRARVTARDGRPRTYPLLVAARGPAASAAADGGGGSTALVALVLLAAGGTLLVGLRRLAARRRGDRDAAGDAARLAARRRRRPGPAVSDAATLPPDAADALAVLRRDARDPDAGDGTRP